MIASYDLPKLENSWKIGIVTLLYGSNCLSGLSEEVENGFLFATFSHNFNFKSRNGNLTYGPSISSSSGVVDVWSW